MKKQYATDFGVCARCGVRVRQSQQAQHARRVHKEKEFTLAMREAPRTVPCPHCSSIVRVDRFEKHLVAEHKKSMSPTELEEYIALPQPPSRTLVRCPECGVLVRGDRLEGHLRKPHASRRPAKASAGPVFTPGEFRVGHPHFVEGGAPGLGKRK